MIDLRQLKYFVVVAEEEHVGRAAERLHISQSPLSRQIAQLEERLGLTLFERNQQRIRLTADGQTFLAETRSLLTHANRTESLGKRTGRGGRWWLVYWLYRKRHAFRCAFYGATYVTCIASECAYRTLQPTTGYPD